MKASIKSLYDCIKGHWNFGIQNLQEKDYYKKIIIKKNTLRL